MQLLQSIIRFQFNRENWMTDSVIKDGNDTKYPFIDYIIYELLYSFQKLVLEFSLILLKVQEYAKIL